MHLQPDNAFRMCLLLEALGPGLVENVLGNGRGVGLNHI